MDLCLNIFCVGQAARGPRKIFNCKRGPQPKKFGNRWNRVYPQTSVSEGILCVYRPLSSTTNG